MPTYTGAVVMGVLLSERVGNPVVAQPCACGLNPSDCTGSDGVEGHGGSSFGTASRAKGSSACHASPTGYSIIQGVQSMQPLRGKCGYAAWRPRVRSLRSRPWALGFNA